MEFFNSIGLDLNVTWYILLGVLLTGYAILDGFDLGVGILHLFGARSDTDRRTFLNAIGPVWDGNEVWLVTGGGALFAAFPEVYATAFSGFYLAFMMLLAALIFRAVSIEFRSKEDNKAWRTFWDWAFSIGSFVAALLMGVAIGNIAQGIPLDADHEYAGNFMTLLNPYALLTGIMTVALFGMHGGLYLTMKTEGDLQRRVRGITKNFVWAFLLLFTIHTISTIVNINHAIAFFWHQPATLLLVVALLACVICAPILTQHKKYLWAFGCSAGTIALLMVMLGLNLFPNLLFSVPNPEHSLTIYNAASSQKTLGIMLIIALIGMPLVIAYTTFIYYVFRGKVKLDKNSY